MMRNRRNIEVLISGASRSFINRRELFSQKKSNTTTERRKTRARVQKGANKEKETNASEKTVMALSTMDC